jgi:hypothetical protein
VLIFGFGKGVLINLLFTSQKSLKKHTVLSFFGVIKDGKAHSDAGYLSNTSSLHSLSTSLMMVPLWTLALGELGHGWAILPPLVEMRRLGFPVT